MTGKPTGTGPGAITDDGCSVDLYALLLPRGEAELIHAAIPEGAGVLELGCGTGRITRGLLALGHPVTGVDFSTDMLAHVPAEARTVHADIAMLRLDERFDVVTLTSNMVNGDPSQTLAFLRTARAHMAERSLLVIERLHPRWADPEFVAGYAAPRTRDGLTQSLHDIEGDGTVIAMTIRYEHDGRVWTQSATMHAHSDDALSSLLAQTDLRAARWLDDEHDWLLAAAATADA
jgi:SAM-dependent methyltransferase